MTTPTPALACSGLTKRYGALLANDAVDFELLSGEIHVLLGENGAGKSTLMNMLYGMSSPDAGEIRREGWPVTLRTPTEAIASASAWCISTSCSCPCSPSPRT